MHGSGRADMLRMLKSYTENLTFRSARLNPPARLVSRRIECYNAEE